LYYKGGDLYKPFVAGADLLLFRGAGRLKYKKAGESPLWRAATSGGDFLA
jgi:hypothetical protein